MKLLQYLAELLGRHVLLQADLQRHPLQLVVLEVAEHLGGHVLREGGEQDRRLA